VDRIDLTQHDRRNLYHEDAQNVFAVTASAEDDEIDIGEAVQEALDHLSERGSRFAFVVLKIER
jgi:hypothetical protein